MLYWKWICIMCIMQSVRSCFLWCRKKSEQKPDNSEICMLQISHTCLVQPYPINMDINLQAINQSITVYMSRYRQNSNYKHLQAKKYICKEKVSVLLTVECSTLRPSRQCSRSWFRLSLISCSCFNSSIKWSMFRDLPLSFSFSFSSSF